MSGGELSVCFVAAPLVHVSKQPIVMPEPKEREEVSCPQVDFADAGGAEFSFERSTFSRIEVHLGNGADVYSVDQASGSFNDEAITVQGRGVIVWDFTAWGWAHMILGVIMVLTSAGLLMGLGWARVVGVIFATLNAIAQVGLITANPRWSISLIALDVIVIYQLTARWVPASVLD